MAETDARRDRAAVISVVIPALNEDRAIGATLATALSQTGRPEIIVVDGGSDDRTVAVVRDLEREHESLRLLQTEPGRARQMNEGAAASAGEWLLFLHADTLLPEGALEAIEELPEDVVAGCFHQRFSNPSPVLRWLSLMHNMRFRVTRVIYGDQAMIVRRRIFDELGGFPERPMEDVAISLGLRRRTTPVMLPLTVTTDSRKFDQMGHWRAVARSVSLLMRFRWGADVAGDRFFDEYR